jgi:hypothetical protein
MTRESESIDWQKIESFVGYGDFDAPIVFLGMEEGGPSESAILAKELAARSTYSQVHSQIKKHANQRQDRIVRSWRPMCHLMLRFMDVQSTSDSRRVYQNRFLGISGSSMLTAELMPYPRPNMKKWLEYYNCRYHSYNEYWEDQLPKRKKILREFFAEGRRDVIICYGKRDWYHYGDIFDLSLHDFGIDRNPLMITAKSASGSTIVFCRHFSTKFFNTDGQLESLYELANVPGLKEKLRHRLKPQIASFTHPDSPHSAHSPE